MNNGRWTLLTAVLLVVLAGQWSGQARPVSGAGPGTASQSQGRYQIMTAASHGVTHEVYVLDTLTSEVWMRTSTDGAKWRSLGGPAKIGTEL